MYYPLVLRSGSGRSGGCTVLVTGAELDPLMSVSDPLSGTEFDSEVMSTGAAGRAVTITPCAAMGSLPGMATADD